MICSGTKIMSNSVKVRIEFSGDHDLENTRMEEDDVFSGIKTSISKYPVRTDNIFLEKTK